MRPSSALSAEIGLGWNANRDDAQWIKKVEKDGAPTRYVFGRLDQTKRRQIKVIIVDLDHLDSSIFVFR